MTKSDRLFHIALRADWDAAREPGAYRVSTLGRRLEEVGFIHLSFVHQVASVANAFYRGRSDLLLLELAPDRLAGPVRVEAVPGAAEHFPHLYGEIPTGAVVAQHPLVPRRDGSFAALR